MKKVTGIGGIFFKCADADKQRAWYQRHLGITPDPSFGGWIFQWRDHENPERVGATVWSPMPDSTNCFDPGRQPFMINYRVENLDALLEELRREGVQVDEKREDSEYGRFAWIMDPEGNRIELWEPPANS
ncbi:MAG: VOC family protein [Blastocatellia bacterium]